MLSHNELFTDKHGGTFRLLSTQPKVDIAHVFGMDEPKSIPRQWSLEALVLGVKDGTYSAVGRNGPMTAIVSTGDKYRELLDWRWNLIQPLVSDPAIYFRATRGALIEARAKSEACSPETIWTLLRLYWRGGMTKDALRPRYHLSGIEKEIELRPGSEAAPKHRKPRGRKPAKDQYTPFVMTADIARQIEKLTVDLLRKKKTNTRRHIYSTVIRKKYSVQNAEGKLVPLPKGERPSPAQVLYIMDKSQTLSDVLKRKHGEDSFENNFKPMTGDALEACVQVGQYFEIDATIVDLWIVADANRAKVIGKATLYLVVDKFSRLIVGFHISLDKPSRAGAMEAMMTLVEDKEKLCRRYGFEYRPEDWPAHGIFPFAFVADRGSDFIGNWIEQLTDGVSTSFINNPARRAPRKPVVECMFKLVHVKIKDNVGGYTPPSEWRERQIDDHSGDAFLTMKGLGLEILECIRKHNHSVLKGMKLPPREVLRARQAIPVNIWNNDVAENAGLGSKFAENFLRFQLLPRIKADESGAATVTHHGILFRGLLYECDRFHQQDLFLQAKKKRFKVDVTYDRRLVDAIYIHDEKDPTRWDTALLTKKCADYGGLSFAEFEAIEDAQWSLDQLADEHNLSLDIDFDARAEQRHRIPKAEAKHARKKAHGQSIKSGGKALRDAQARSDRARLPVLPSAPQTAVVVAPVVASVFDQAPTAARPPGSSVVPRLAPSAAAPNQPSTRNAAMLALLNLKKS